jgi:hypothetical protein
MKNGLANTGFIVRIVLYCAEDCAGIIRVAQ